MAILHTHIFITDIMFSGVLGRQFRYTTVLQSLLLIFLSFRNLLSQLVAGGNLIAGVWKFPRVPSSWSSENRFTGSVRFELVKNMNKSIAMSKCLAVIVWCK